MTKRQAILAAIGGIVGLMSGRAKAESTAPVSSITIQQIPQSVSFSFDTFKEFTFSYGGESVTLTGKEMFAALKSS